MTLITAEGVYHNGTIELLEPLREAPEGRVLVTFLGENGAKANSTTRIHRPMQFGRFAGPDMSTEDDFVIAEWHGEDEFDAR